jgi:tetratricopeptide (TPR) repeat protein
MTHPTDLNARLERYEAFLGTDPTNRNLLADCIDMAIDVGATGRAERHLEAALRHHPGDPFFLARQANLLMSQRRWQAAADLLAPLLASFAEYHLAFNLATAYSWLGRYDEAWDALEPFAAQAVADGEGAALAVRIQHHRGRLDEAQALADRAKQACGGQPGFLGAASVAYFDGDRPEDALRCSEQALAGSARPLEASVIAGSLALGFGDAAAAKARFADVLALNPDEGRAWNGLGLAGLIDGDFTAARTNMEKAVERLPAHVGSWHGLAWARLFGGDLEGSAQAFGQALELDRNLADSHGGLAAVDALRGRRQEAEAGIDRALRLDRTSLAAAYARMLLNGEALDGVRFREVALRLLGGRAALPGMTVADVVRRAGAR